MINVKEKKLRELVTDEKTQSKMKETLSTNFEIMKKNREGMKVAGLNEIRIIIKYPFKTNISLKKQLEDQNTLLDCVTTNKSFIHLALRIRGGKPVILLYDNEKKRNEAMSVNIKFNEAMNIEATYPEIKTTEESEKIKEYEWKGTSISDGENNCKLTVDIKEVEYLFWEDVCLKESKFEEQQIRINQQHFETN
ncbi:hypothetical protein CL6EHI_129480 [Entamoeba histolytica]|uniref:Uncharacterized protein n=1 Tax=Entamoeba histolytica TaxID=5759 RepID=A0A175JZ13_ENTHI|nr:hypothetical protein CL6EHI_129480 [Entamoeba histolytica]